MRQSDCIFCKMAGGFIPVSKITENEFGFVIKDIQPQARTHLLVIPKKHIRSLADGFIEFPDEMKVLMGELSSLGFEAAKHEGLFPDGFRVVINTNEYAGQTVFHLHLHVLGGEPLTGGFA